MVDPRIVPANFKYSGQDAIGMLAVLKTGESPIKFGQSLVAALDLPSEIKFDPTRFGDLFKGLLAAPDESPVSGEKSLEIAEASVFKSARDVLRNIIQFGRKFRNNLQTLNGQIGSEVELAPFANSFAGLEQREFKTMMFFALVGAIQRGEWPPKVYLPTKTAK
ncbi:MAG: hypothetical protein ABIN69_10950 [Aestuariivirga sp.]